MLDMRTVIISYIITSSISVMVIFSLWWQSRKRLSGLSTFFVSYLLQFTGLVLIALRGSISDFYSILIGNVTLLMGNVMLMLGLRHFFNRPGQRRHAIFLIIAFILAVYYFTFLNENLLARIVLFSLTQASVYMMGILLIYRKVQSEERPEARDVLIVLVMYVVINLTRVMINLIFPPESQNFFASGLPDSIIILVTQMMFLAMTFALVMMVNRRLYSTLERDIAGREEAENALARKNRQQERLGELGRDLAGALSLEDIFRVSERRLREMIDCPNLAITLFDHQNQVLTAAFISADGQRVDASLAPPLAFDPQKASAGRALAIFSQQVVLTHDLARKSREGGVVVIGDDRLPDSAIYVPMVVEGKTLGLLELQSYRSDYYAAADGEWLQVAANQIGLSIQNARLFNQVEESRQTLLRTVEDLRRSQAEVNQLNATLEQRVRERTAELQAANKELESFASTVSHDLRAPLRAMAGFSDALASDYRHALDEQGLHYLERIQSGAKRMGQLIDDLLNLSRVTRQELNRQKVDFNRLAGEVIEELRATYPNRTVEVNMPARRCMVNGDPRLLKAALTNLLDNAWKYTTPCPTPQVWLECRLDRKSGQRVFSVRDNGVGFDMQAAGGLFTPFQRLHSTRDFPGSGIGLATVQRIIQRHGGRIWVEAAVGKGAAFYFTLG